MFQTSNTSSPSFKPGRVNYPDSSANVIASTQDTSMNILNKTGNIGLIKGYSHIAELEYIGRESIKKHITLIVRNPEVHHAINILMSHLNTDEQGGAKGLQLDITCDISYCAETEYVFFDIPNYGKSNNPQGKQEQAFITQLKDHDHSYSFIVFTDKYRNNPFLTSLSEEDNTLERRGQTLKEMHESSLHGNINTIDCLPERTGENKSQNEQEQAEWSIIQQLQKKNVAGDERPTICIAKDTDQANSISRKLKSDALIINNENLQKYLLQPHLIRNHSYIIITKHIIGYLSFQDMPTSNLAFFYYVSFDKLRKLTKQAIHRKNGNSIDLYNYIYKKWGFQQDNQVQSGTERSTSPGQTNIAESDENVAPRKYTIPNIVPTEVRLGLTEESNLKRYSVDLLEKKVIEECIFKGQATISFDDFANRYIELRTNIYLKELFKQKKPGGRKDLSFKKYLLYFIDSGVITLPSKEDISQGIINEGSGKGIEGLAGFLHLATQKGNSYNSLSKESPYFTLYLGKYHINISDFNTAHKLQLITYIFGEDFKEIIKKKSLLELQVLEITSISQLLLHAYDFEFSGKSHKNFSSYNKDNSLLTDIKKHPYLTYLINIQNGAATLSKLQRKNIVDLARALYPNLDTILPSQIKTLVGQEFAQELDIDIHTCSLTKFKDVFRAGDSYGYFKLLIHLGYDETITSQFPSFSASGKSTFSDSDFTLLKNFLWDT